MPETRSDPDTAPPRYKPDIHKVKAKSRPIAYASHVDSLIYSYYCERISALYEAQLATRGLQQVVLAYRRFPGGKSNIHFANEAFAKIAEDAPCEAVALDIESFFDRLQPQQLKRQWMDLLGQQQLPDDHYAVYKAVTSHTKVDRDRLGKALGVDPSEGLPTDPLCSPDQFREAIRKDRDLLERNSKGVGIPQGSPISGLLANIYMLDVDTTCMSFMQEKGGSYRRYSDDILLISPPGMGSTAETFVGEQLNAVGLTVAKDKTSRVCFIRTDERVRASSPLQYLGFLFDGERRLVRSQTLARLHRKMIHAVRCAVCDAERSARRGHPAKVWRRQLYNRYSHLGTDRTYFRYYRRAMAVMQDDALRAQHRRLWRRLHELLDRKPGTKKNDSCASREVKG